MLATLAVSALLSCLLLIATWLVARRGRSVALKLPLLVLLAVPLCFCLVLSLYIVFYLVWPAPGVSKVAVYPGIEFSRIVRNSPERTVINLARVDLTQYRIVVSAPDFNDSQSRYLATTTRQALKDYGGVLAVNASFFSPFRDNHLFDYYPHSGDRVEVVGTTLIDGRLFGAHGANWPMLALTGDGAEIGLKQALMERARPGLSLVSGKSLLVEDGIPVAAAGGKRYPRTAVGTDRQGRFLWLVVVDGKQPLHSKGMLLSQLASLLVEMGVHDAIEFDGGGSSTMAVRVAAQVRLLSRPSHTNLPGRERPVANHLIVIPKSQVEPKPAGDSADR